MSRALRAFLLLPFRTLNMYIKRNVSLLHVASQVPFYCPAYIPTIAENE